MNWDALLNAVVMGLGAGVGSTIGAYLVNRHLIRNWERLEQALRERANGKGEG